MISPIALRLDAYFGVGRHFRTAVDHLPTLASSLLVAVIAAYVALELASRMRVASDRVSAVGWWIAGSAAMGSGIWSMHFVGMSAVDWPFEARFLTPTTLASWGVAMLAATVPIWAASRRRLAPGACWGFGLATASGVAAMHFLGLDALRTSPPPVYAVSWLIVTVVVATSGCAWALRIATARLRVASPLRRQTIGAMLLGGSLTTLHFLAMASADFADNAVCTTREGLEAELLGTSVGVVTLVFLALMLLVSTLEKRSHRLAAKLGSSLNKARDELHFVTFNDATTGLPNRLVFQQRLRESMEQGERTGRSLFLLVIEIDDFGRLERSRAPDDVAQLIRQFGQRLVAAAVECSVASAGGPQFLILTPQFASSDPQPALEIAERIAESMHTPFKMASISTRLSASIGIAIAPSDGGTDKIVGSASVALQAARSAGGNGFAFFESEMDSDAQSMADLLEHLRFAIDRGELELHYQPKVHASGGQIGGVEALLRWQHPTLGFVSPAVFIPLAERFGLISDIGCWVLDEAVRQMAEWRELGIRLHVAVNVSAVQLRQARFDQQVVDALARHTIDPDLLVCEITESEAMRDTEQTLAIFKRLQDIGVRLSIDDFGTGYSSLAQLRRMPVRQLKVDRSFVNDLPADPDACVVVKAIIDLAHALRLEVVAEGVETEGQRDMLQTLGCDTFQGYLFARPMPASALTKLLMQGRSDQASSDREARARFRESVFLMGAAA